MRTTSLALLLLAGACDSASGGRVERYTGVLEVALTSDASMLELVAVDDRGCGHPLRVETPLATSERLHVRVEGIQRPSGPDCRAIIPARARVALPFREQGTFPVYVEHAGSRDEYRYSAGFAGVRLEAVRTSTTRLGTG